MATIQFQLSANTPSDNKVDAQSSTNQVVSIASLDLNDYRRLTSIAIQTFCQRTANFGKSRTSKICPSNIVSNVSSKSILDFNNIKPPATMSLMSLPTEIHYHLEKFLDHPSLLFLSATNKYFEGLSSKKKVNDSLLILEKSSVTMHTVLTRKELLPCYICLKGLPKRDHFPPLPSDKDDEVGNKNMGARACATCLIATKPDCIFTYQHGVEPQNDWVFSGGHYSGLAKCKLYTSRYGTLGRQTKDWLLCQKCNVIKRYESSPFGRRRKIDEAVLKGDMCPQCYQPVWDQEDEDNRLRRNARARRRNRGIKKQAQQTKEAERKRQQAEVLETAASTTTPTTTASMTPMNSAAMPITSATSVMNTAGVPMTTQPLSSRLSMPATLQIPMSTYVAPLQMDGTPVADEEIDSGFMEELEDAILDGFDFLWDISSAGPSSHHQPTD